MKTTFFAATLIALTAVSCSKTELSNDSPRMIGFSAETGKMTKALTDDTTFPTTSNFGVFSYSVTGAGKTWEADGAVASPIMGNVKTTYQSSTWKAETGTYYWPNDVSTKLTFFAYSPHLATGVSVDKTTGINFANYVVAAPADVDLMVADKVADQTYATTTNGSVPLTFKHVLTQVLFTVKTDAAYAGITFTITDLKLTNITSNGTYTGSWAAATPPAATATYEYVTSGATKATNGITPVPLGAKALLPQPLTAGTQELSITYEIKGTGVAAETVTKTMDLHNASATKWDPNMKITYNLSIGLKEITFSPTVTDWTSTTNPEITVP